MHIINPDKAVVPTVENDYYYTSEIYDPALLNPRQTAAQ